MLLNSTKSDRSVRHQIGILLSVVILFMVLVAVMLSVMLISINTQYSQALLCANIAAGFNSEFKSVLDAAMYNHVLLPRTALSVSELPMEELDKAIDVLRRLENATLLPDNRWRIRSMQDMCENLRKYMIQIAETDSFDQRIDLLERNIRGETGLTTMIQTYMHDFVDDEVRELARLSLSIRNETVVLIVVAGIAMMASIVFMLVFSMRIAQKIVNPLQELSQKAEQFGGNDFSSYPVDTNIIELRTLDLVFEQMARRINTLLEQQIKDARSLHKAELELLQAQINPHFLYNTLDSIVILSENGQSEEVIKMVTSLSVFFRNSLNRGKDMIQLRAEVDQAVSYLQIQQIRYSDILSYEINIPEALLNYQVPKLILQPVIENALYHGLKNRRQPGTILLTGEVEKDHYFLKVRDNGAGMSSAQLEKLQADIFQDHHSGLGLINVYKRIRLYYGSPYGLFFDSKPGEGTTVSIMLPYDMADSQKEGNTQ